MRENQRDFWAILAALVAIGIGTMVSAANASGIVERLNQPAALNSLVSLR